MNTSRTMTAELSIKARAAFMTTDLGLSKGALSIPGQDDGVEPKQLSLYPKCTVFSRQRASNRFSNASYVLVVQQMGSPESKNESMAVSNLHILPTKTLITTTTGIRATDLQTTDCLKDALLA